MVGPKLIIRGDRERTTTHIVPVIIQVVEFEELLYEAGWAIEWLHEIRTLFPGHRVSDAPFASFWRPWHGDQAVDEGV